VIYSYAALNIYNRDEPASNRYRPTEAKMFADQMIGHKLITKQTGEAGRLCNAVYIVERKFARREFYLAILMDRQSQAPIIVASSQGGMDIETVAKESPDAIRTTHIDIHKGVTDDMARNIATELGFSEQCIEDAKDTIQKLYKVFMEKDATQIEINPLSETTDHQVMAMDAKLTFDDNADFRQKEVFSWRDTTQEDADEVKAAEYAPPNHQTYPKTNPPTDTVLTLSNSMATSAASSTAPASPWPPWTSSSSTAVSPPTSSTSVAAPLHRQSSKHLTLLRRTQK